ncbi:MAG TPA: XRE family transcriptional regulator [Rhizomicrobium sp.]|jgi:transcriptional regulator with XRE-family HTH domain|nr:XRE family transcriptional regulator [Rhizomicrobium sp.]
MAERRLAVAQKPQRSEPGSGTARPGAALRALRMQRGWTLAEVSKRTDLPISTLSKIENDRISLSYDKLARISTGLGVDISQLFVPHVVGVSGGVVNGRRSITLAGQGQVIETENYGHIYPAADFLNKRFVPVIAEIRARSMEEFGEMIRHVGEEFAFVLEGAVEFHSALYAPVLLRKGDSIYFDSGMGHAYLAAEPGLCRVLSICSGPESHLIEALRRDGHGATSRPPGRKGLSTRAK